MKPVLGLLDAVLTLGGADGDHAWSVVAVDEADRASPSAAVLATMADIDRLQPGDLIWVIYRNAQPLVLVTEGRIHVFGRSVTIEDDPWTAMGQLQWLLHSAKNAIK